MENQFNILRIGREFHHIDGTDISITQLYENGIYSLDWDKRGPFLVKTGDLKLPEKLYDVDKDFRNLVLKSFHHYDKNMGVCLVGQKGTGKTVTAKLLAMETNLPIILIENKIPAGVDFIGFLRQINQPFVLLVDEFEKLFASPQYGDKQIEYHSQQSFLSYTDGLHSGGKKMFIFTCNKSIDDFFLNRPSRIRYLKKYEGLDKEILEMIIESRLQNKDYAKDLVDNLNVKDCTIDILVSIIDEINVHDVPYSSFKENFNFEETRYSYIVSVIKDGVAHYDGQTTGWYEGNRVFGYCLQKNAKKLAKVDKVDNEDDFEEDQNYYNFEYLYRKMDKYYFVAHDEDTGEEIFITLEKDVPKALSYGYAF